MSERAERIVVLGADAAGMSAAHQALRGARAQGRTLEMIAFERGQFTSWSACGLPYWISGEVGEYDELVARTPAQHREMGIDLRTGTTITTLDVGERTVGVVGPDGGAYSVGFDQVVIATGARPIVPAWALGPDGTVLAGIGAVKVPEDGVAWIDSLTSTQPADVARPVVIVGGGYIGLEMTEAVLARGWPVVLVTRSRIMSGLEPSMSERVESALRAAGATIVTDDFIVSVAVDDGGAVNRVVTAGGLNVDASLVVIAQGVRPSLDFVRPGSLPLGGSGALLPDATGRLAPGIWAAGDCCEVRHRVSDRSIFLPLGTHANKQGKVVGTNVAGGDARFEGVLGTAITRFARGESVLEISRTGLSTREAVAAGFDPVELTTEGKTASGYMPESTWIATSIVADRRSRRLLGAQIVGGRNSAKRIDTIAAALWGALSVDDLASMDLSYAPPFATVWEAVQLSARRLSDRMPLLQPVSSVAE